MSDKTKGLYQKYRVERTDGTDQPGCKHDQCPLFVLDTKHDPHARVALKAYAESCADDYPVLTSDLLMMLEMFPLQEPTK